jgi:phosphoglycolate phosphatase-like HAD superfamily hydrolase
VNLRARRYWIFDLDGTLTVAVHDFEAIRRDLDLPPGKPILEQLAAMPEELARARHRRLASIEVGLAQRARAQAGVEQTLARLRDAGATFGILTRNSKDNAIRTLRACGLMGFFEPRCILGRDCADPKPSGAGIRRLLDLWGARPGDAVMVGDYLFDLLAGRDAGTATVYLDPSGTFEHGAHADVSVRGFDDLARMFESGP